MKISIKRSMMFLNLFFLTGCYGSVDTVQCIYNARSNYFLCRDYRINKDGFFRSKKKWRVPASQMNGFIGVPADEYSDTVWPKMKEAWEYCKDKQCF